MHVTFHNYIYVFDSLKKKIGHIFSLTIMLSLFLIYLLKL